MPKGENLASAVVVGGICGWGQDTFCLKCGKQTLTSCIGKQVHYTSNTWEASVCVCVLISSYPELYWIKAHSNDLILTSLFLKTLSKHSHLLRS